jgi:DNA-binding MarR family transcriptional regulator
LPDANDRAAEGCGVAENEQLIADIIVAQERLERLFAYDRSDPIFNSHLTLSQLRIMLLVARSDGGMSGSELAAALGVGLATLTGMIDRLVANDLVIRQEDPHDRRVRRITLSRAGAELMDTMISAGVAKGRRLLSRLSAQQLATVCEAMNLLVKAAEAAGEAEGSGEA